jgi:hypothetical protein
MGYPHIGPKLSHGQGLTRAGLLQIFVQIFNLSTIHRFVYKQNLKENETYNEVQNS